MHSSDGNSFVGAGGRAARVRNDSRIRALNEFMRTPAYVVLIAVMTAVSNLFSLELYLYSAFILIGIYISVFGIDYLPMMPIVICCYIAPSPENNPGRNEGSIFYPQNGGIYLIILAFLFVFSLIYRLCSDHEFGKCRFLKEERCLVSGMLFLGLGYLLSGLGMKEYGTLFGRNLLFAIIQFASIFVMYYIFSGAVKWDRVPKEYFAWIGLCVGYVVLVQLMENYLSGRIFMEGTSTMDRELISTGWGMHNNIGGLMAMTMPFAFYLASKRRHGWVYNILGTVLLIGVVLSCSRTSMIVAAAAYCVCAVVLLRDPENRKTNIRVYLSASVVVLLVAVLFFRQLWNMFALFFEELFLVSERDNLLVYGMKQFASHPIFGGSFYPQGEYVPWDWSDLEVFTSFFPPRWHNTLVQVAASCGVVGLIGYGIHRFQTVRMLIKNLSLEKLFILISIGILLVMSLLDCHFFNVGPVLFYSMALAFAEKIERSKV